MCFRAVLLLKFIVCLFRMAYGIMMDLIVAVDAAGGIGKNGTIPWKLRKDMKHFKQKTSEVIDTSNNLNKVIVILFSVVKELREFYVARNILVNFSAMPL